MAANENSPPTGRISWPPTAGRRAALAQSAERFTRNEQVVGSIPTGGSATYSHFTSVQVHIGTDIGPGRALSLRSWLFAGAGGAIRRVGGTDGGGAWCRAWCCCGGD